MSAPAGVDVEALKELATEQTFVTLHSTRVLALIEEVESARFRRDQAYDERDGLQRQVDAVRALSREWDGIAYESRNGVSAHFKRRIDAALAATEGQETPE